MSGPEEVLIVRTTKSFYWLVGGLLGAVLGLSLEVAVFNPNSGMWLPTVIMCFLLAISMSWLISTKLVLTSDAIHYRSLFIRTDLSLDDIVHAEFVIGFSGYKPYQRIVVEYRDGSEVKEATINMGLLDRLEVKLWMNALKSRLK